MPLRETVQEKAAEGCDPSKTTVDAASGAESQQKEADLGHNWLEGCVVSVEDVEELKQQSEVHRAQKISARGSSIIDRRDGKTVTSRVLCIPRTHCRLSRLM